MFNEPTPTPRLRLGDGWALTDGNLVLRPAVPGDIPAITTAMNDPVGRTMLAHWVDLRGAANATDRRDRIHNALLGPYSSCADTFTIERRDKIIGVRWLTTGGGVLRSLSCGGWLHANHRGWGHGRRALTLVMHFAARTRNAKSIHTGTREDNLAAQANLTSCGFTHHGHSDRPHRDQDRTDLPDRLQIWSRDLTDLAELGPIPTEPERFRQQHQR